MTKEELWIEAYKNYVKIDPKEGKIIWIKKINPNIKIGNEVGSINNDYRYIMWNINGKQINIKIHRIIWTFVKGAIPEGNDIHHKDENPLNNKIENLEILSDFDHLSIHKKGNQNNTGKHWSKETRQKLSETHQGEKCPNHKLTEEQIIEIRRLFEKENISIKQLAENFNVRYITIWSIVNRKRWKHLK